MKSIKRNNFETLKPEIEAVLLRKFGWQILHGVLNSLSISTVDLERDNNQYYVQNKK